MLKKINHISITVNDLEKSIKFYQKTIGLKLIDKSSREQVFTEQVTSIKGVKLLIAYLQAENCKLELIQYLPSSGKQLDNTTSNIGSTHLCFEVSNFDQFLKKVLKAGGRLTGKVTTVPGGPNKGKKVVYTKDPDGYNLEFFSTEKE
ncbi:MAG: VOC family protein [Candidatus Woesebacteria bacterium]|jgi:catechol 2,3-dioxygenase-like lactoylglutathione lyase family enzyme